MLFRLAVPELAIILLHLPKRRGVNLLLNLFQRQTTWLGLAFHVFKSCKDFHESLSWLYGISTYFLRFKHHHNAMRTALFNKSHASMYSSSATAQRERQSSFHFADENSETEQNIVTSHTLLTKHALPISLYYLAVLVAALKFNGFFKNLS